MSYTTGEDRRTAFNINNRVGGIHHLNSGRGADDDLLNEDDGGDLSSDHSVCDATRESFWPVAIRYQAEPLEVDIKQISAEKTVTDRFRNSSEAIMMNMHSHHHNKVLYHELNRSKMLLQLISTDDYVGSSNGPDEDHHHQHDHQLL